MSAVRIRTRIDSDTLYVPELRPMIGKEVEIIVIDKTPSAETFTDPTLLDRIAGNIDLDWDAIEKLRDISKI